jgi:hypothetical protein
VVPRDRPWLADAMLAFERHTLYDVAIERPS